ncbi:stage IV sporulation protein B [Psychrobacillus sp. OK028]|uniref:SpoIVB peptidase S55 domain-containing protein n=1 Tax=Psychrobacillus sp. OK028 TaxID=1884359 RepID=UPI00088A3B5B|nr:SpoIVB peptidase S55 domain-containing protein [Psychrobacillus sp. OK028]SDM88214.1 stage IV sporulation protein B [Psychrobacillus sp. OK028]
MKKNYRKWSLMPLLFFTLFFANNSVLAEQTSVIPLGQSIQIDLQYGSVFVSSDVLLSNDEWLRTGDSIHLINKRPVTNLNDVKSHMKDSAQITIQYEHKKEMYTKNISPNQMIKLLPFLRDATEGIGTLTYFDPITKEFGALGHQIVDQQSGITPKFSEGSIYLSSIEQIKKSMPGKPGYKITSHKSNTLPIGGVNENNVYGVFGKLDNSALENISKQKLEIVDQEEIMTGKAIMRTSIDGEKVQDFTIEISSVEDHIFQFTVTDKKLIEKTGGILQGMSGSPIIQKDKLVGVVTHMYVDKPENGAALAITEMMKKSP